MDTTATAATRVYWAQAPHRPAARHGSIFTAEPFVQNGTDSDITHNCYGCGDRIGYSAAKVVPIATSTGDAWTLVHLSFTGDAKAGILGTCSIR